MKKYFVTVLVPLLLVLSAFSSGFIIFNLISLVRDSQANTANFSVLAELEFIPIQLQNGKTVMVAKNETPVQHWQQCVEDGVCPPMAEHRGPDHPITNVSWNETITFINWYARISDLPVRIPTRSEWLELAADHAPVKRKPLFTDPRLAWAADYDITATPQSRVTEVIGSFGENRYGLSDLKGNVWEWVDDCYFKQPSPEQQRASCPGARIVMGERVSSMVENRRKPGNVGCYSDQPPANVGLRLIYDLSDA